MSGIVGHCGLLMGENLAPPDVFWNPSDSSGTFSFSNGNKTFSVSGSGAKSIRSNVARSSGKWYYEAVIGGGSNLDATTPGIGIANGSVVLSSISSSLIVSGIYGVHGNGNKVAGGAGSSAYGSSLAFSTVMIALDLDNGRFFAGKAGSWFGSGDPAAGIDAAFTGISGTFYALASVASAFSMSIDGHFSGSELTYSPPAGFLPWAGV